MKRKILVGSMLSVLLILSIAWINPIYAYEIKEQTDPKGLHEKLSELSSNVINDGEFAELVDLIDIPAVKDIFSRLLNPDSNEDPADLAQEFYDVLEENEVLLDVASTLESLQERYQSDFDIVEQKTNDILDTISDEEGGEDVDKLNYNYVITHQNSKIKLRKVPKSTPSDGVVVKVSEESIAIPGLGDLEGSIIEDIICFMYDFGGMLTVVGVVLAVFAEVIVITAAICSYLGLETISLVLLDMFYGFGIAALICLFGGLIIFALATVLERILNDIEGGGSKEKKLVKPKLSSLFKNFKINILEIFEQVLKNIRGKTTI